MKGKFVLLFALLLLLIGAVSAQDESYSLTIMHTNDVHGHHEPQRNGDGGAAGNGRQANPRRS